jgi:hypothetical protein
MSALLQRDLIGEQVDAGLYGVAQIFGPDLLKAVVGREFAKTLNVVG